MELEINRQLFAEVKNAANRITVAALLKSGADVNAKDQFNETPLIYAAQGVSLEIVKLLVNDGAKIDFRGEKGWTPLRYAVVKGRSEIARFLVENGAKVNSVDTLGETPLYAAVFKQNTDLARFLIRNGAELNFVTRRGGTCLMTAVGPLGSLEMVRLLVESDADLELKANEVFIAAVHSASAYGGTEILKYLLENGLSFFTSYPAGPSIIESLEKFNEKGTQETIRFLKAYSKSKN